MTPEILHSHGSGSAFALSGIFAMVGTALGAINPFLQTIAYCVSIVAGICAIVRAVRK